MPKTLTEPKPERQRDLEASVAAATGESVGLIADRGFELDEPDTPPEDDAADRWLAQVASRASGQVDIVFT